MPTETVYGLAADAFDPRAIVKIFDAKERPRFDPLIVHVAEGPLAEVLQDVVLFERLAHRGREVVDRLVERAWPGPLTLVLPKAPAVPDLVTAGRATVAVRMPAHPVTQALLAAFGGPLVAPSANRFGSISPTTADHVRAELEGRIDAVIDAGPCPLGVESTIVAVDPDGAVRLLRPGAMPVEDVEEVVGPVARATDPSASRPESPGQLSRHYAPRTRLVLVDDLAAAADRPPARVGLLRVLGDVGPARRAFASRGHVVVEAVALSAAGELPEAAQRLFAGLRQLDDCDADVLIAERCPVVTGLGHAIADRLRRASADR